jgi:hypothetical protein
MAPLKPGDTIWSKSKPNRKGAIHAAVTGGKKHEWIVLFEGAADTETLKSQQLLRKDPTANDIVDVVPANNNAYIATHTRNRRRAATVPPLLEDTGVSSSHNEDNDDDEEQDLEDNLEKMQLNDSSSTSDHDDEEVDSSSTSDDDEEVDELLLTPPTRAASTAGSDCDLEDPLNSSNEDNDIDEFASGEAFEDTESDTLPPVLPPPNTNADEAEEEDILPHGEIAVEPQNIHKAKWEKYVEDKANLLVEGWKVSKTGGPNNEGIIVGSTVRTRTAERREGLVIGETLIEERKHWIVSFGETEPEPLRPLQLVLVRHTSGRPIMGNGNRHDHEVIIMTCPGTLTSS